MKPGSRARRAQVAPGVPRVSRRSFTLLELLAAVLILGTLVGLATISIEPAIDRSRERGLQAEVQATQVAADSYYFDTKQIPGVVNPGEGSRVLVDFGKLSPYLRSLPLSARQVPGAHPWAKYFVIDGKGVVSTLDDPVKPWGSVDIAGGAEVIYSLDTTVDLWAVQMVDGQIKLDGSGKPDVTGMQYRLRFDAGFTDQDPWDPLPSDMKVAVTLPPGEGQKYVFAQFRDAAGNVSDPVWDVVTYSMHAPGGAPDLTPPTAPENLTGVVISHSQIDMQWSPSTDDVAVVGYRIYRSADGGNIWVLMTTVPGSQTSYSASGLLPSTEYRFRVTALDAAMNESEPSNVLILTTPAAPGGGSGGQDPGGQDPGDGDSGGQNPGGQNPGDGGSGGQNPGGDPGGSTPGDTTPPTAPTNLTATAQGTDRIALTWSPSTDDTGVAGYEIWRAVSGGSFAQVTTVTGTSYTDTGLSPSVSYSYYVVAFDAAQNRSQPSSTVTATTLGTVSITNVTGNVTASGSTQTIRADVTASESVQSVTVYYRDRFATTFNTKSMSLVSGNTYEAQIPVGQIGSEYYIRAVTVRGAEAVSPAGAPATLYTISRASSSFFGTGKDGSHVLVEPQRAVEDFEDDTYVFPLMGNFTRVTFSSAHSGTKVARLSATGPSATAEMYLSIHLEESAILQFWYYTSSSTGGLQFFINGQQQMFSSSTARSYTDGQWQRLTFSLSPGPNSLTWRHINASSASSGSTYYTNIDDIYIGPPPRVINLARESLSGQRTAGDAVATAVTKMGVDWVEVTSTAGFAPGDEVMLVNANSSVLTNIGNYEFKTIASISGARVTFTEAIARIYGDSGNANLGTAKVQMVRVPHYQDLTLDNVTLTTDPFDGAKGGYLAIKVRGVLTIRNGGAISVDGLGRTAEQRGPGAPSLHDSTSRSGGSGGSYGTLGGKGGQHSDHAVPSPGSVFGSPDLSHKLYLGAGGNRGRRHLSSGDLYADVPEGGRGGGALWIAASVINSPGFGALRANGAGGGGPVCTGGTCLLVSGAGGGSGGSLFVAAETILNAADYFASATGGGGGGGFYLISGVFSCPVDRAESGQPNRGGSGGASLYNYCSVDYRSSVPSVDNPVGAGGSSYAGTPSSNSPDGAASSSYNAGGGGGGAGRVHIRYSSSYNSPKLAGSDRGVVLVEKVTFSP